ncbi:MAG: anthranilate synthase component [Gemmatimonadetes bacterium]|nr:anthranilate synthase component [Gemmatimonadota bacterium]
MTYQRFRDIALPGHLVPVWRDVVLDSITPLSAFTRLRRGPFSFLLESAPAGGETWARYTFMGTEPRSAWRLRDDTIETWTPATGWHGARPCADPLADLERLLTEFPPVEVEELGDFWAGAVGYFSYDVVRQVERLPSPPPRANDLPDALFVFTRVLAIVDNLRSRLRLVAAVQVPPAATDDDLQRLHAEAERDIADALARLATPAELPALDLDPSAPPATGASSLTREEFIQRVDRIKDYIAAGDAFQVLLARRISLAHDFDSTSLYRALRVLNPSPYMYHLALDGIEIVGSSPELLVRVAGDRVTVRPIAGTRRRGKTAAEDQALTAELKADEKERAEHLMLVDLGRNDVGRIARYGTVNVTDLMVVERYSHVLHMVSQVEGIMREGLTAMDALRATFPAGTMTGAPKVRAMQIIDELEPVRRGPYAGAIGYLAAGGRRMDLAITIRTCVISGGEVAVQAGGGIVHDSVPALEWEETESKARAMLTAIGQVRAASGATGR